MKLCKDCKHVINTETDFYSVSAGKLVARPLPSDIWRCQKGMTTSVVDGVTQIAVLNDSMYCAVRRLPLNNVSCGLEARQWEPAEESLS